ncbi:MAG TPA: kelch repeat-containing protein [Polyangium sp.]|nr:kelch repeat-containing protein [Polyangium sp.]
MNSTCQASGFSLTRCSFTLIGTALFIGCAPNGASGQHDHPQESAAAVRDHFRDLAPLVLDRGPGFVRATSGFVRAEHETNRHRNIDLVLPEYGDEALHFRGSHGVEIDVREVGALGQSTREANAIAYARVGGSSFWTATAEGFEEWIHLREDGGPGQTAQLVWEVSGAPIAQDGPSVVVLDPQGFPALRVTAPVALDRDGRDVPVAMHARDNRIELFVETNGADVLADLGWMPGTSMGTPRYGHTATTLANGDVLVVGGLGALGASTSAVELWSAATGTWTSKAPLSVARTNHTATLMPNGRVLVVGGTINFRGTTYYDVGTNSWTAGPLSGIARRSHTMTVLNDGRLLVAGGYNNGVALQSAELFDGTAWIAATDMNEARAAHTATLLNDGRVLVTGGTATVNGLDRDSATYEIYEPRPNMSSSNTWTITTNTLTAARSSHWAVRMNDGLVRVGGSDRLSELYDPSDPSTDTWTSSVSFVESRKFSTVALLPNGITYVVGGTSNTNGDLASTEFLLPNNEQRPFAGPSLAIARNKHSMNLLNNGRLLVAGGIGGSVLSSVEILATNLAPGSACSNVVECASGFCVDGVCCLVSACYPVNSCREASVCQAGTGTCSDVVKPDGSYCDDGNACTRYDICKAGACLGTSPIECNCHITDVCNPVTGTCSEPAKPDGSACDDGNICTQNSACKAGICVGTEPIECNVDVCQEAYCDPLLGCQDRPSADGTTCDDGDACSLFDTCQNGSCTGQISKTCPDLDPCHVGYCSSPTGQCTTIVNTQNALCSQFDLGTKCVTASDCKSGFCVDGVCCESECVGKCLWCAHSPKPGQIPEKKPGYCLPEDPNRDRRGSCSAAGSCLSTCSDISDKPGADPCVPAVQGSQCAVSRCLDSTHSLSEAYCVNDEQSTLMCPEATVEDCGDYGCDDIYGTCRIQCVTVRDCAPERVCDPSGYCVVPPPVSSGTDISCALAPQSNPRGFSSAAWMTLTLFLGSWVRRQTRLGLLMQRIFLLTVFVMLAGCSVDPDEPMAMNQQEKPSATMANELGPRFLEAELRKTSLLVGLEQAKLDSRDGLAVSLSGDTAVLEGRARVFVSIRKGTTWTEQAVLFPSDGATGNNFGSALSISGDTTLVGAKDDDLGPVMSRGSAYVFVRNGLNWTSQGKLVASDSAAYDYFGTSVSVSGNTALVGAPKHDVGATMDQGAAYIFVRNGSMWTEQAKLVASDGAPLDSFGSAVSVSGDTALVGATWLQSAMPQPGGAYVFVRNGDVWTQQAKLVASDAAPGAVVGYSVSISGDTALVGTNDSSAAYVFVRNGTTWTEQAKLVASDGTVGDSFGDAVSVWGDTAVVGARRGNAVYLNQGVAYVFVREGTTWTEQSKIFASTGMIGGGFGKDVSLSGDTALIWEGNNNYVFVLRKSNGDPCSTAMECLSGYCVDGVCCATACNGPCDACSIAAGASQNGLCEPLTDEPLDGPTCDDDNLCTNNDRCQDGVCRGELKICPGGTCYDEQCDPLNGMCTKFPQADGTTCNDDNACTLNDVCQGGACNGDRKVCPEIDACHWGVCAGPNGECQNIVNVDDPSCGGMKLVDGMNCLDERQCVSGHCIEGVCCDSTCEQGCFSCVVPDSRGKCSPERFGEDHKGTCGNPQLCSRTCSGMTDLPAGTDPCVDANAKTKCVLASCLDETHALAPSYCVDGKDTACPVPEVQDCVDYACNDQFGRCRTDCVSVKDCAPGRVCDPGGRCVAPPPVASGEEVGCTVAHRPSGSSTGAFVLALLGVLSSFRRKLRRTVIVSSLVALSSSSVALAQTPPQTPSETPPDLKAEATLHYEKARRLMAVKDWAAAYTEFVEANRLYTSKNAQSSAAVCLKNLHRYDEALERFDALLRDFNDVPLDMKIAAQREIVELRGLVGTIDLRNAEVGASITVDGRLRGEFPMVLPLRVPAGSHLISLYKEGYETLLVRMNVLGGSIEPVDGRMRLLVKSGTLRVEEQNGQNLEVLINGTVVGKTPWEGLVGIGQHTVALRGEDQTGALPKTVEIVMNAKAAVVLLAEKLDAQLRITPSPVDASIAIDSIFVSRGIWDGRLRPGKHVVSVVADGYFPKEQTVTIERGKLETVDIRLKKDPSSIAWRTPGRFGVEAVGAFGMLPSFGGDVTSCSTCDANLGLGGSGVVHITYETWKGLGFGGSLGYMSIGQTIEDRPTTLKIVGVTQPDLGFATDTLLLRALRFGVWGAYRFGAEKWPIRVRLGMGGVVGTLTDTRTGRFRLGGQAGACSESDLNCFNVGPLVEAPFVAYGYVAPEVRIGYRFSKHLEVSVGVEALVMLGLVRPKWNDAGPKSNEDHAVNAAADGYGTFGAESLIGTVSGAILPGLGIRYEF